MTVVNDVWDYTLGASSTPWYKTSGNPFILAKRLQVTKDDAVRRDGLTGSYVAYFAANFRNVSDLTEHSLALAPLGTPIYTPYAPGFSLVNGIIQMGAVVFGDTGNLAAFGTLDENIPISGSDYSVLCYYYFKPTAGTMAARFVYRGVTYSTGFVSITSTGWTGINFYSQSGGNGAPNKNIANVAVGPMQITYGLTDSDVATLYAAALPIIEFGTVPPASVVLMEATGKMSHAGLYLSTGGAAVASAMHNEIRDIQP